MSKYIIPTEREAYKALRKDKELQKVHSSTIFASADYRSARHMASMRRIELEMAEKTAGALMSESARRRLEVTKIHLGRQAQGHSKVSYDEVLRKKGGNEWLFGADGGSSMHGTRARRKGPKIA